MAVCVAGVLIALSSRGGAQGIPELERRLDRAVASEATARRERELYQRTHEPPTSTYTDTLVAANGMVILSNQDTRVLARAAGARADSSLRRQLGPAATMLRGDTFTVRIDTVRRGQLIVGHISPSGGSIHRGSPSEAASVARTIVESGTAALVDRSKSPFSAWRRGSVVIDSSDANLTYDWSAVRFALVASSAVARRCYSGDLDACAIAVGLEEVEDPATVWYDSVGRFEKVRRNMEMANRVNRLATARCQQRNDAGCIAVIRASLGLIDQPTAGFVRASLISFALGIGGDGATARMITSPGSPSDALSAAAGVPIDTLLSRWQRNTRSESISSRDMSVKLAIIALGWIALLALLACRSSRWR